MNTMGYDFKDAWFKAGELSLAFRVSGQQHLCGPHPDHLSVRREGDTAVWSAKVLTMSGGQQTREGQFEIRIRESDGKISVGASARLPGDRCLRMMVIIRGMDIQEIIYDSENIPPLLFQGEQGIRRISWPGRVPMMPLIFLREKNGTEWSVLSKEPRIRQKTFAAQTDRPSGLPVLILSHAEDTRHVSDAILMPEWHLGKNPDRNAVVRERLEDLRVCHGLSFLKDREHPPWLDSLQLVANFHGVHWTGHVFSTFSQMEEELEWMCGKMDPGRLLVFLPAWDGPYYRSYPLHEPSPLLGGKDGLKRLVETCHRLGTRVVPMLGGPNLVTFDFLKRNGMEDAALKTRNGHPKIQDWVDWNNDQEVECEGIIGNFGHPGYLNHMKESSSRLVEEYGFDGIFLDGAIRWENAPDYSPYDGMKEWSEFMRKRHPDLLLMAEDAYDAQWGLFDLLATYVCPLGPEKASLAFARMAHYLAYPGPDGSCGIHEQAWHPEGVKKALPGFTIPTLSMTRHVFKHFRKELEAEIRRAMEWKQEEYRGL